MVSQIEEAFMFLLDNVIYKDILSVEHLLIKEGQTTSLFGPSGCGKTTLLRLLCGLISPTAGQVLYKEQNMEELDLVLHRKKVIMMPQISHAFPGNLRDNLNIGASFQERPNFTDAQLDNMLEQVSIKDKNLEDNPELFSGGEKQRLALARILLLEPEVILLDEPSAALDAQIEETIMGLLNAYKKQHQMTYVLVTHSEKIANAYSEVIVYMDDGRISRIEEKTS